ncbi:P-body assembly protein [Schizosaccharomyces osmophilus]|uniref:p-body assembly protein n=1 Tax=Schizosaccharomyces osmophilus TaxID=2545709 RepID=A0AAE9WB74_9SCHI|nr:P-body assembly protein [Schizosaccharomyces osmophilus]WBW73117.1 P-body assembly protein [Schizosaccharomyces osmophilus]
MNDQDMFRILQKNLNLGTSNISSPSSRNESPAAAPSRVTHASSSPPHSYGANFVSSGNYSNTNANTNSNFNFMTNAVSGQQQEQEDQRPKLLNLFNFGADSVQPQPQLQPSSSPSPSASSPNMPNSRNADALLQALREGNNKKPESSQPVQAQSIPLSHTPSDTTFDIQRSFFGKPSSPPHNPETALSASDLERMLLSSTDRATNSTKANSSGPFLPPRDAFESQTSWNAPSEPSDQKDPSNSSSIFSSSDAVSSSRLDKDSSTSAPSCEVPSDEGDVLFHIDNPGSGDFVWETTINPDSFRTTPFPSDGRFDIAMVERDLDAQDNQLIHTNKDYIAYSLTNEPMVRVIEISTGKSFLLHNNSPHKFVSVVWGDDPNITNHLMVIDTTGQVIIYSIDMATASFKIIFQLSGAQSLSDPIKSRFHWYPNSSRFFAVALSKHIIFFDLDLCQNIPFPISRSIGVIQQLPCFLIDTGISAKEYDFSADGTVFATVDKDALIKIYSVPYTFPSTIEDRPKPSEISPIATFTTRTERGNSKVLEKPINLRFISTPGTSNSRYLIVVYVLNQLITVFDTHAKKVIQKFRFSSPSTPVTTTSFSQLSVDHDRKTLLVGNPPSNTIFFFLFCKEESVSDANDFSSTYDLISASVNSSQAVNADAKFSYVAAKKFNDASCVSFTCCKLLNDSEKYCIVVSTTKGYEYYTLPVFKLERKAEHLALLESKKNWEADVGGVVTGDRPSISPSQSASGVSTPRSQTSVFSKRRKDKGERHETKHKGLPSQSGSSLSSSGYADASMIENIVFGALGTLDKNVQKNYEGLKQLIVNYKTTQEKHFNAVLSAVSSTLTENTGKILESVVDQAIKNAITGEIHEFVEKAMKDHFVTLQDALETKIKNYDQQMRSDFEQHKDTLSDIQDLTNNVIKSQSESDGQFNELTNHIKSLEGCVNSLIAKVEVLEMRDSKEGGSQELGEETQPDINEEVPLSADVAKETAQPEISDAEIGAASPGSKQEAAESTRISELVEQGSVREALSEWCTSPSIENFKVICTLPTESIVENCSSLLLLTFAYHTALCDIYEDELLSKRLEYIAKICLSIDVHDPKIETVIHPVLALAKETLIKQSSNFSPVFQRRLGIVLRAVDGKISEVSPSVQ